ncbi:bifunctional diguanylate cyclase/phosphodiesterase [Marinisporobacter balticus]|uniref:Diguanylate cyclase (GGDEF)-like protein n=1 Tax=Marinisporobacter balticus TaxID=2018667 RepID=A0A4R2KZR8_9FIRM|nr:EAL domain-containing protein [Marinisporobacter balticus]TCO76959.1 diguanylate cyclase (GGDEF)-like protein [Marinisporobacter balticus]
MENIKLHQRIKTKILTMFFVTSLVIAAILIFMSENLSINTAIQLLHNNEINNTELYAKIIGARVEERMNEIEIYANSPLLKEMDWEIIEPYLKKEINHKLDTYDNFFIADTVGNSHSTLSKDRVNIQDREYFHRVMEGKKALSNPVISKSTRKETVVIAVPIKNEKEKVIGLMGADVNLRELNDLMKRIKVEHKSSYSYIVTKEGLMITNLDKNKIMKDYIAPNRVKKDDLSRILKESKGSIVTEENHIISTNYFHAIPNTDGWKIITKVPVQYIKEPIRKVSTKLFWLGIIGIILTNIAGFVLAGKISKPIIGLNEVFLKGATGDLAVRAEINAHDEIGMAANSFNIMMEKIQYMTDYDILTDLPNRGVFHKQLTFALSHAKRNKEKVAVMVLGLNRFKNINDILGHDVGDKLLQEVGAKLKNCVAEEDLVSRIGGSEFTLLFTEIGKGKKPAIIAQKILDEINKPWQIGKNEFYITSSIGIAYFPDDGKDEGTLLKNADIAMHRVKEKGGNNYQLYTPSMNEKLREQLSLEKDLHNVLENQELLVYYQPKVDINTENIMGMEALLRWKHPQEGMISPAIFIPLAEENDCILKIGEWVLRTACHQNKQWQDAGYEPVCVAVNISVRQFQQPNFVELVAKVLEETELNPKYLELEITESIAVEDINYTIEVLNKLKDMKIKIAMDDFGTGYSSLSYLKKFAIDNLKIDQSFVRDIISDQNDAAIAATIIAMGNSLNMKVTAEGVETKEQWDFLKDQKCDYVQGYLFSPPVPSMEFEKMLRKSR